MSTDEYDLLLSGRMAHQPKKIARVLVGRCLEMAGHHRCDGFDEESYSKLSQYLGGIFKLADQPYFATACMAEVHGLDVGLESHSVHSAICGILIAKVMKWSPENAISLGVGLFYHDMGIQLLPDDLVAVNAYQKMGSLDRAYWERHPLLMADELANHSCVSETVRRIVAEHHEDGTSKGYPRKLKRTEILPLSKFAYVVDQYSEVILAVNPKFRFAGAKKVVAKLFEGECRRVEPNGLRALELLVSYDIKAAQTRFMRSA